MNEAAVSAAVVSAIREAFRLGAATKNLRDAEKNRADAMEFAQQLIVPAAVAFAEQAREEGYQEGRASRAEVAA
jgi:hypothetical protein